MVISMVLSYCSAKAWPWTWLICSQPGEIQVGRLHVSLQHLQGPNCIIDAKRCRLLFQPLDYDSTRMNKSPRTQTWCHCECNVLDLHVQKGRRNSWVTDVHIQLFFCMHKVCNYIHFICTLYPNWLSYQQTSQIRCWIFAVFTDKILPSKFSVIWGLVIYFFCLQIFLHRQELQEFLTVWYRIIKTQEV